MYNLYIDLMAFNEKRLDPTVTNDRIKIHGYEIVRCLCLLKELYYLSTAK